MNPIDLEIIRCIGWDRLDEFKRLIRFYEISQTALEIFNQQK